MTGGPNLDASSPGNQEPELGPGSGRELLGRVVGPPEDLCSGCTAFGFCRFGVRALRLNADGSATAEAFFSGDNEGGPGVTHGGWTAGLFDEVLGLSLNLRLGVPAVTRELSVLYRRPVPINRKLLLEASGTRIDNSRQWQMHGILMLASNGMELSSASGVWVERDASHYLRHKHWLQEQDRAEA